MRSYPISRQISPASRLPGDQTVFRPGQIFQGEILRLYPNHKAEILIGGRRMYAQMEAALTAGGKYHFQVQSADGMIHLKVINEQKEKNPEINMKHLLRQLGLKAAKPQLALIEELNSEKISFTRKQLANASVYLDESADKQQAVQVLKQMIAERIPINRGIFQALYTKETETFSHLLKAVLNQLTQNTWQDDKTAQKMIQKIQQLTEQPLHQQEELVKDQFLAQLKMVLRHTGLSHENIIRRGAWHSQSESIKSMLIQLAREKSGAQQDLPARLLHFINGLQLNSVNETEFLLQLSLQIPAEKLGLNGDLQLDIEGERTVKGLINPEQCRVVFYLDLKHLRQTVIDMQIQKRTAAITVFNDRKHLDTTVKKLVPKLKKGLSALDYHLSAVTVRPLNESGQNAKKSAKLLAGQTRMQGVDYRI